MGKGRSITVSAPGKVHLLGEHSVVYGKPTILTTIDKRATVTVSQGRTIPKDYQKLQNIINRVIQKALKLKRVPFYSLEISSQIPLGSGLGSSAALSAAYIGALLTYLRVSWDKNLINELTYEAEKIFQGNPSGGDNSAVVFGGLIWFRKETATLKLIHPLPFFIPQKLSRNFILINTGKPLENTAEMVKLVEELHLKKPRLLNKILEDQEKLAKDILPVLKIGYEKEFIKILRQTEANLESLGVVSKQVLPIIRRIEQKGGGCKITGAGGKNGASGMLLCYHKDKKVVEKLAKIYNLLYFSTKLGVEGVRLENV